MRVFIILLFLPCMWVEGKQKLTSIHLIDRHGITETITSKERLLLYEKTDFLSSQPYDKVTRFYNRDRHGKIPSIITTYHPNGVCHQYLEILNQRACGLYKQWYPSGQQAMSCKITGGLPDVTSQAKHSWLFESIGHVWDEEGHLLAECSYHKGVLEGPSKYYHPNGNLWKELNYVKDQLHGIQTSYLEGGNLLETTEYLHGKKHGISSRFWDGRNIAAKEYYQQDALLEGEYFLPNGEAIATITHGKGKKAVFGEHHLLQLEEYNQGVLDGKVTVFSEQGIIAKEYSIHQGEKEGEELFFYEGGTSKLSLHWNQGSINGISKTWYPNGTLESQKEWGSNQKTGLSILWYPDGSLMAVEEYDHDQLIKGEYYALGNTTPLSKVDKGTGIVTLFSPQGHLLEKITYKQGVPEP